MNDHFDPEGAEGVYFTREPELFTIKIRDCDVDSEYAAEIARGVEVAKAEFAEIWPEHGERIVEEAKTALYTMAVFGMAYNPLANFLHGADFYVSRNVEGRETFADRFARFYGPAGRQERLERTLWALLSLLDPEVYEALRKRVEEEEAEAAQGADDGGKFKLEWLGDLNLDLNGQWLFKKLFPRTGVVSFYGDSRSFKTFLMIHASYCATTGNEFAGRKVKNTGPVVYIAAEDGAGVKARAVGYHMANAEEKNLPPRKDIPLAIVDAAPNLGTSPGDLKELIARVEDGMRAAGLDSPSMIVADTLNQTLGSEDESTTGMQAFMANATELARHFKCCVVAVNHVGHAEKGRERGGSQIKGNADGRIWVERPDDDLVEVDGLKTFKTILHVVKVKNGADGFDLEATLREVVLGTDEDGDEESTLAVVALEELTEKATKAGAKPESKREAVRREFCAAYHQLANDVAATPGLDGHTMVRKVRVEAIRDLLKRRGHLEAEDDGGMLTAKGRTAFKDARASLTATGKGQSFIQDGDLIWMLYPDRPFAFGRKDKVDSLKNSAS